MQMLPSCLTRGDGTLRRFPGGRKLLKFIAETTRHVYVYEEPDRVTVELELPGLSLALQEILLPSHLES